MKKFLALILVLVMAIMPVVCVTTSADEISVQLSHQWAEFSMGETHAAAIQPEGLGYAWGYNYDGPIGNGILSSSNTPTPYHWGDGIAAVSANNKTTAYLTESGELYLMGRIWWGVGGSTDMPTPYVYPNGYRLATNVRQMSMGFDHLVFVKNDNTLWVYGENEHGQLGTGNTTNYYTPRQALTNVSYAVAGDCLTAAVKTDGSLVTAGYNASGQVGNNSTTDQTSFVQVLSGAFTVSCFGDHVMAIKTDGSLWAWGRNDYGQLGRGNTTNQKTPVQVMTGVAQVSAGMYHTGAIKTDGSLWFCGNNWRGCFGNGTTSGYSAANSTFTRTEGSFVAVSCGNNATAALSASGQLFMAGANGYGQLGTGATAGSVPEFTPIDVWIFNAPSAGLPGDVNCDGMVTMADLSALSAYLLGKGTVTEQGLINGDVNHDGTPNVIDMPLIYQLTF